MGKRFYDTQQPNIGLESGSVLVIVLIIISITTVLCFGFIDQVLLARLSNINYQKAHERFMQTENNLFIIEKHLKNNLSLSQIKKSYPNVKITYLENEKLFQINLDNIQTTYDLEKGRLSWAQIIC